MNNEQENPNDKTPLSDLNDIPLNLCPAVEGKVCVFPSAVATYFAQVTSQVFEAYFESRLELLHP